MIPMPTHQIVYNVDVTRRLRDGRSFGGIIVMLPREASEGAGALAEVEEIMRVRHGLRLDEPNDFDVDHAGRPARTWERISQAVMLALVVISSIALMVEGIGVMAIMMISVTERTREIGVRKALGARRHEVLFQFLSEAAVLTSIGGVLGILCGSGIGVAVQPRPRDSRSRCPGGRSRSASASPPASASSSGCCRRSAPRASTRSRRCASSEPPGGLRWAARTERPSPRSPRLRYDSFSPVRIL